jgi:pyruvate, water dikinase
LTSLATGWASRCLLVVTALLALACGPVEDEPATEPVCGLDDGDPRGPACSTFVGTDEAFETLSLPLAGVPGWQRATKYTVPASEEATAIPALVQNVNRYKVHRDFLEAFFLPGLDLGTYADMVIRRETRQYFAGNLIQIDDSALGRVYGFTIYTLASTSEQLQIDEVLHVFEELSAVVGAGSLVYTFEPSDLLGAETARAWVDPGFPIVYPFESGGPTVEVYTPGAGCGRVRRLSVEGLDAAVAEGTIGYRDLVVVDGVPFDIDTVVAGLVTGTRQWELSHVNVRLAHRGTPNLFVADALSAMAAWDGQLVRLEALHSSTDGDADSYSVTPIDEAEAEACWDLQRPQIDDLPATDREYRAFDGLREMDVDDEPVPLAARFGGKAAGLAKLYAFLDDSYEVPGFGIPFAWFEDFLDETTIADPRDEAAAEIPLRDFVARLAEDPEVAADALLRHEQLALLRGRIREGGHIPGALIEDLSTRIIEIFGAADVRVRFRSSSNVEDALSFSGAGLYDSTTVCAEDSLDGDQAGPSACDPGKDKERDIERGLRKVWASLYNDRAWDERDWYQVPQDLASMALLVSLGFPDEEANGVAFTGDPADPSDPRYLVNAQLGDEDVVSNDASTIPEGVKLELVDGEVVEIFRISASSLVEPGATVLGDDQLYELGGLMAEIAERFPIDLGAHDPSEVLLDLEFKIAKDGGGLKIKQIRPFLRP